jgi:hypothetical protein
MLTQTVATLFSMHAVARSKDCKYYNIWRDVNSEFVSLAAAARKLPNATTSHLYAVYLAASLRQVRRTSGHDMHILEQAFYVLDNENWLMLAYAWHAVNYGVTNPMQDSLLAYAEALRNAAS